MQNSRELQPKTQQETNTAKSYNVYRNGAKLNTAPVTETNYTDRPEAGIYTYTVTAVHENCESHASAPAIGRIVDLQEHSAPDDLKARVVMNRSTPRTRRRIYAACLALGASR